MNSWMNLMTAWSGQTRTHGWPDKHEQNAGLLLLGGIGLGAGLMYLLDPNRGRRRRAIMRDTLNHAGQVLNRAAGITSRDISHRAVGLWAEGSHLFTHDEASDEVLTARVRSKLGRAVSHPHAINVIARDGHVSLSGDILASEVDDLLSCVAKVRGVEEVENHLTAHDRADGVPSLQGGRPRHRGSFELMQNNWSPTARLLTGVTGGALLTYCLKRRDHTSEALGTLGFFLLMRGLTNWDLKSLVGAGRDCRAIEVQKTININAPVGQVFEFWNDYQNFPRFLSNVREVRPLSDGRSQWTVAGPVGIPVSWTAEMVEFARNERLVWRTAPGTMFGNEGEVHFEANHNGGTRVHVRLCYHPPGGALGHALAKLFGADPKSEMDADLARMKTLIETGHAPHDAAKPAPATREAALTRTTSA
jgi:uncharacterized membrane protein